MKKQQVIEMIRQELGKKHGPDAEKELDNYFESLDQDEGEFLDYILAAGLTLEGIIKLFNQRTSNIAFMDQLIKRFYDPSIYYGIVCSHCEPQSAMNLIIQKARAGKKTTAKIYHEKFNDIETVEILNN